MAQAEGPLSVFVDLDNTIVYQSQWSNHPAKRELEDMGASPYTLSALQTNQINERLPEDTRVYNAGGLIIAVRRRPHAEEFLQKLRGLVGTLCCLTMGKTEHQTKILKISKLDRYFDVIVGRDKYQNLVSQQGKNWLLIDDLDPRDPSCMTKLNGLDVVSDRALRVMDMRSDEEIAQVADRVFIVPAYDGQKEDNGLLRIWSEVEGKIRTLGRLKE
jgi:phosphoglycolate phosphatase-like HAD superfamily hydrolase